MKHKNTFSFLVAQSTDWNPDHVAEVHHVTQFPLCPELLMQYELLYQGVVVLSIKPKLGLLPRSYVTERVTSSRVSACTGLKAHSEQLGMWQQATEGEVQFYTSHNSQRCRGPQLF